MNQSEREKLIVKRLKIKLGALAVLLTLLSLTAVLILSGLAAVRFALALSSNYSKAVGQQLTVAEWNNLPNDFVARTGGAASAIQGALDMANNQINNLAAPTGNADAVNKQYVDTAVSGVGGGGDTFINWGQGACPSGTSILYSGYVFNNLYSQIGGGSEPVCVQSGDAGPAITENDDGLYPLGTGVASQLPPGIPAQKEVRCAVCYRDGGTCYERFGGTTCPGGSGFTPIYTGYSLGGHNSLNSQINRHCVDNLNFDGSVNNSTWGAVWYGTNIQSNTDVGLYTPNTFLKCAVCCN